MFFAIVHRHPTRNRKLCVLYRNDDNILARAPLDLFLFNLRAPRTYFPRLFAFTNVSNESPRNLRVRHMQLVNINGYSDAVS